MEITRNFISGGGLHQTGNYSRQVRSFVEEIQADGLVIILRACEEIPWNGLIETGFKAVLRLEIGDFAKKSQTLRKGTRLLAVGVFAADTCTGPTGGLRPRAAG